MKRLCTPGWIARHVLTVVVVAGFIALGWWQVSRAAAGNTLSWAYAFEWPVFAGFVGFLWFREARRTLRDEPAAEGEATVTTRRSPAGIRPPVRSARPPVATDEDDPELTSYNRYLSWLNANPGARPGDYPG